jgi:UDP-glucose 4-epimerase
LRILVTGGAGFIGSHLVERLVKDGHDVLVMDDLSTGDLNNLREIIDVTNPQHFCQEDIREYYACHEAVRGREVVFHLAALGSVPRSIENPFETNEVNVRGTLNMLEAAREVRVERFINFSSSSVYGDAPPGMKVESQRLQPLSPYGVSKLAAESYCRVFTELGMLSTVTLRPFNVFGPRQHPGGPYAAVIPRFIQACLEERPMVVFGDGHQTRDFTYVSNVVDACLLASGANSGEFNVGCGDSISVERLAGLIGRACGVESQIEHAPARKGDVEHSEAWIGLARNVLGYVPKVNVAEGIIKTVEWFKEGR